MCVTWILSGMSRGLRHEQGCTSAMTRDLSHDQGLFFVDVRVRDMDSLRHEQGSQA